MSILKVCKYKRLSKTQTLVARMLMSSKSITEMAKTLNVKKPTIKFHIWNIYKIFEVNKRYEFITKVSTMMAKEDVHDLENVIAELRRDVEILKRTIKQNNMLPIGEGNKSN